MRKIWKYSFEIADTKVLEVPRHSMFLHAEAQNDKLTLWFEVETENTREEIHLNIVGTGFQVPNNGIYLTTIVFPIFVWHIYVIVDDWYKIRSKWRH